VRDITFENITCHTEAGILNYAAHPELIKGVTYRNVEVHMQKESKWDPRIDLRPNGIESVLFRKHNAFEIFNATSIKLEGCTVVWDSASRLQYGEALFESNSKNISAVNFVEVTR
jgi:hypothetical protein